MPLTNQQFKQLHAALIAAYDESDLRQMVKFELGEDLNAIGGGKDLSERVFNLIEWADKKGRLSDLVNGALAQNPHSEVLQRASTAFDPSTTAPAIEPVGADPGQSKAVPKAEKIASDTVRMEPTAFPLPTARPDTRMNDEWRSAFRDHLENKRQFSQELIDESKRNLRPFVIMTWVLLVIGIAFFVTAIEQAVFAQNNFGALFFGGLTVAVFLVVYLTRPFQAISEASMFAARVRAA